MVRETAEVGVIVERRALDNPWIDHVWMPVAVLAGAPTVAPWTVLHETGGLTRFYAGAFELELFPGALIEQQAVGLQLHAQLRKLAPAEVLQDIAEVRAGKGIA